MSRKVWKPGTFLYPLPVVMVSCGDMEKSNIITVAILGTLLLTAYAKTRTKKGSLSYEE